MIITYWICPWETENKRFYKNTFYSK